ncbi:dihydrolipoyl dehydrogenase family protein [Salisediminibacterium halotolerans]|uniref:dihydrolipoyl dehydrogenase family protein n=1 Tax=Salisediminibacterium halotolerans TaxID=517425 RepID=UPI000EABB090|nr:FAD-dependent oxidoreductase [Salisediminibacterium halotolerans]RLJ75666.1 pyruvate/2-oxoglutarate dehydrogenase complex dihydrolipoamide dehydrogenase (E3) component [Actinophytocola xinjiangensis]RPE89520.1 pyruvate/2-oxoglutarate dehydrogenase complex dihydrolipoamide dehydrogenase (E3) component [Salisediminibacterium halotolerans]TWG36279.1 pyruvate/2-oxoglutarate dehydrogenase complex dihydrolipoamide dehydrogenase (E3) component [Salisediminibacterium halotolerans]GEL07373.1 mercuric
MKGYDLIVIGGGAGGLTAAAGASSLGADVALVEKDGRLGGDCLHYGCVPSKALLSAANDIHRAGKLTGTGFTRHGAADMTVINERVQQSIAAIQAHDSHERFENLGVDIYTGTASFLSETEIAVEGREPIRGKRIILATGSRPAVPPIPGLKESGFLTNKTIFQLKSLPKRFAVIGGGPIGVEMAQAFSRLGSDVTIIEQAPRLFNQEDRDISREAERLLAEEIGVRVNSAVTKISVENGEKRLELKHSDDSKETIAADEILLAAGRQANSDTLELDKAGVATDQRGAIPVNRRMQTSVPSIYAIGDVNGAMPFTHVAGAEGQIAVQNAVFGLKRKIDYANMPWVIYTDPEVFHLGETEEALKQRGADFRIYKTALKDVDRFVAEHRTDGFVKLLTDPKGVILGAHAVGNGAGDFMQEAVLAKQQNMKIGALAQIIHPYPNHAAAVQTAANLYWREKLFAGPLPKLVKRYISMFR